MIHVPNSTMEEWVPISNPGRSHFLFPFYSWFIFKTHCIGINGWKIETCLSEQTNESWHDKTNKMAVRPAKTQIGLGIRPVGSEYLLSAWGNLGSSATHLAHAQSDLSLHWTHSHFIGFVISWLKCSRGVYSRTLFRKRGDHNAKPLTLNDNYSLPKRSFSYIMTFISFIPWKQ